MLRTYYDSDDDFAVEGRRLGGKRARRSAKAREEQQDWWDDDFPSKGVSCTMMAPAKRDAMEQYANKRAYFNSQGELFRVAEMAVSHLPTDVANIILERSGVMCMKVVVRGAIVM